MYYNALMTITSKFEIWNLKNEKLNINGKCSKLQLVF